eukprot:1049307-Pyramimonas_sp.AAC.1
MPKSVAGTRANCATGALGGAPFRSTTKCEECAEMGGGDACERCHWDPIGGAHYGTTKRVNGVPIWVAGRMRSVPLGPSVELPMGHETCEGCAGR